MSDLKKVKKLLPHYVYDNCFQEMIEYNGELVLLGPDDTIYSDLNDSKKINKYLTDERRKKFPYNNIPIHYEKKLLKKVLVVNQIFEFEKPYLRLSTQGAFMYYGINSKEESFLIKKSLQPLLELREEILTRKEIEDFFDYESNKRFVYKNNILGKLNFPSNEKILNLYKKHIKKSLENLYTPEQIEKFVNPLISTISSVPNDFSFMNEDDSILLYKCDANNIELALISLRFMNEDAYKIIFKDIPIHLCDIKNIDNSIIIEQKDPKIDVGINPNISQKDIQKSKSLIKK